MATSHKQNRQRFSRFFRGRHSRSERRPTLVSHLHGIEALESRAMLASCQIDPPIDIPASGNPIVDFTVSSTVTTDSVSGGQADDVAIWRHPTDCTKSVILGTAKNTGIFVYDLSGNQIDHLSDGEMNNIDVRYGFMLAGQEVDLVTVSNRTTDAIDAYVIDESGMSYIGSINSGITVYGYAMAHNQQTDTYYGFVSSKSGQIEQWELTEGSSFGGTLVRAFDAGGQVEGIVADDQLGFVYIAEENGGLYKYGLDPSSGAQRTEIDDVTGHLTRDTEGLTLYYGNNGTGYLIASAQGANEFVVYAREGDNQYLTTFGVSGVSDTDGIDVINVPMGNAFPMGFFIAQNNDQNFRLVPWESIANSGNLAIYTGSPLIPPPDSADFDDDGFITGSDFLLWQSGLGTTAPNAFKSDGDADNDLDVDSDDLGVWELQYGTATPLLAATAASISSVAFSTEPVAERSLTNSDLVDVAMALDEEADEADSTDDIVAHSPPQGRFSAEPLRGIVFASGSSDSSSTTSRSVRADGIQSPEGLTPWEDAVDGVFASVFE